ncbi:sensor histidine kinase [Neobacillus vireti]|uniref:histidine kinase n=1 Tax=Neobacillus vireti LMG 21834 TaxID=1131730 RepID=A0AB94ISQ5_9BACI|nr:histidine kinase [Neobacillus vireti]ETI70076.1 periplasmic sensor signal transduction histidine kinase [Neobacillus vireti LMG 21834]KLT18308.1 histidine kinase [Neobacillus vireti]
MSYRTLKIITILIPPLIIGSFELIRHSVLLHDLSMETGNYLIILITLAVSYVFSTWMFKMIEDKNHRLTTEREMRAVYEERERLAKELHDNIAQTLFLLKVNLKKGKINEASGLVNSIEANVRQAIYNLRVNPLEMISFPNRVENWLNEWSTVSGIEAKVRIQLTEGYFTPSEEVQLFGIIQEAFTNIRKHSGAKSAVLLFQIASDGWEMKIEDDGNGFAQDERNPNQYGLVMLKERVEKINAVLHITSEQNHGTKIIVKGSDK